MSERSKYYCKVIVPSLLESDAITPPATFTATPAYEYQSVGSNACTLVENDDGTFTETQADGTQHDYNSSTAPSHPGKIFRIRKTIPQPGTWTITRNVGNTTITNPVSQVTTYAYDGNGNLSGITDPYGRTTAYAFSAGGLLQSATTPELCQTQYQYDANSRIKSIIAPDGLRTTYGWDANGLCNRVQSPNSGITTYNYVSGAVTEVTNPLGQVTTKIYDAMRNQVGEIEPLGNRTTWTYDRQLLTAEIPPLGGRTTYSYKTFSCLVENVS
ncbi:hypothetical protein SH668x_003223 [Planctomicrobium sp. SH668]|uniref:hypothetical protein n=1 Tax=Planctomicrobium sp. SH668 TaxID=3448126 RepID=UPI003F5AEB41